MTKQKKIAFPPVITTTADLPRVPFSVACSICDCDSPETVEEAIAAGWTDICYDPTGLSWNFLGYCPEHRDG